MSDTGIFSTCSFCLFFGSASIIRNRGLLSASAANCSPSCPGTAPSSGMTDADCHTYSPDNIIVMYVKFIKSQCILKVIPFLNCLLPLSRAQYHIRLINLIPKIANKTLINPFLRFNPLKIMLPPFLLLLKMLLNLLKNNLAQFLLMFLKLLQFLPFLLAQQLFAMWVVIHIVVEF